MDGYGAAAVILACGTLITSTAAAWISLRNGGKTAKVETKVAEVHELVNSRATAQDAKIERLEALIKEMGDAALLKAEARDAHPPGGPGPV